MQLRTIRGFLSATEPHRTRQIIVPELSAMQLTAAFCATPEPAKKSS